MSRKSHHVVPSPQGGWSVRKEGAERATKHFQTKQPAVDYARDIARNQQSELVIHDRNGRVSQVDSYGHDPYPPKE